MTIIVKQVYWYISQFSGERLQDHCPLVVLSLRTGSTFEELYKLCFRSNHVFFFFFFLFSFTSLSSFFTHIETNQSVGGAKTGVPGEKPPDTPTSRTWLVSHMNSCPVRGANPHHVRHVPLANVCRYVICEPE